MPVKNINKIGPSGNPKPIPIYHSIPPANASDYKFVIETDTTTIDLSDLVTKGSITDGATTTIGSFEIFILDPDQTVYSQFETFDKLKWYADYGDPETLRFAGYIERRGYQDIYTVISGSSLGMIFTNKVIYDSDGPKSRDTILKEIIEENFSEYSINTDNIEEDDTTLDVNYYEVPFTDIIEELCGSTYDFYLDHSFNAHYFVKGSRKNTTDGIVDQNHIETPDNADDTENTSTRVRVYGQNIDGLPLISSSASNTAITKGVKKEYTLTDNSVIRSSQAKDLSDLEYSSRNQIPRVGTHSALLLPTIQPGEKLFMAIPREDITPNYYTINSYTHEFDLGENNDRTTTINVLRKRDQISDMVKKRVKFESKITENLNPFNLDFSNIIRFNTDSGTHNNTEINEGYLKVKLGESSGQWISDIIDLDDDPVKLQAKMVGDLLIQQYGVSTSRLWYSLDGGTVWKLVPIEDTLIEGQTGTRLRFRVDLNSTDAKVRAVGALYSY